MNYFSCENLEQLKDQLKATAAALDDVKDRADYFTALYGRVALDQAVLNMTAQLIELDSRILALDEYLS